MIGLLFGRSVTWSGQARDAHALSWGDGAAGLWPQTLFGLVLSPSRWPRRPALTPGRCR